MKDVPIKLHLLSTVTALGMCANLAAAQTAAEQVIEHLTEQGYSGIEVRQTGQAIHVVASKDGREYEYFYDAVTGKILEQEARRGGENQDRDNGSSDDGSGNSHSRGFDRGEDGSHGHGNSGGSDEDNTGRSYDENGSRSDRGRDGNGRHSSDKPGRGKSNSN